jgi:radical SAM superfamily enzyme YgiQ (UPF0313 family)
MTGNQRLQLLLVTVHAYPSPQAVPLAAAILKACIEAGSFSGMSPQVTCVDFFCGDPLAVMVSAIAAAKPDLVGFSLATWNRTICLAVAAELRRCHPGIMLFAGGPEASADPDGLLTESSLDFLVVGEGELTLGEALVRIAAGEPLAGLAGVAVRRGAGIALTKRPVLAEPGAQPSPWLSGILDQYISRGVLWELSRGCPFGCQFCFDGRGDRTVRPFPLARLTKELAYFVQHGVSQVVVLDSTFNLHRQRAKELLRLIQRQAPRVHFHFEARAELLDPEFARLFGSMTCSVQLGLQTADPEVSAAVDRPLDRRDFAAKIGLLNGAGVVFGFDLLYGLPGDSLSSFRQTLDFALGLYPNSLAIFPLAVLPGTQLAARAPELGLRHLHEPPYTLLESPTFPAADLAVTRRLAIACDIFYSRGKAVAWFTGIVAALRLTPSVFLQKFADWLEGVLDYEGDETDFPDGEVHALQRRFLEDIFRRQAKRFLPAALDYVDYHAAYAAALLASPPRVPTKNQLARIDCLQQPLSVSASTQLVTFAYEILDLLELGAADPRVVCAQCQPRGSFAAIYPRAGQVATESLAQPYFHLLQRLDGTTPAAAFIAQLDISPADAREFLSFAVAEGIVVLS